jgi:hypothetical protein
VWFSSLYRTLASFAPRLRARRAISRWSGAVAAGTPNPGEAANPMREYFEAHADGPGMQKWRHYFEVYHRHLARFVGRSPVVVEIGVFCGGSLPMWRHYFGAGCQVHGVDIDPECAAHRGQDIAIHIGDQGDRAMWKRFREAVPHVDIVIDDGGHSPEQQTVTMEELLPHLGAGGVYICEDVHGAGNRFAEFVSALGHGLNAGEISAAEGVDTIAPTSLQSAIHSLHLYPFLVLIEKRDTATTLFEAPLRGTQWRTSRWA